MLFGKHEMSTVIHSNKRAITHWNQIRFLCTQRTSGLIKLQ